MKLLLLFVLINVITVSNSQCPGDFGVVCMYIKLHKKLFLSQIRKQSPQMASMEVVGAQDVELKFVAAGEWLVPSLMNYQSSQYSRKIQDLHCQDMGCHFTDCPDGKVLTGLSFDIFFDI